MPELEVGRLDPARIPRHVGLILDGNGRWANARGLPRTAGHAAGEEALFDTIEGALEIGIGWLTAFTFSTENWNRAADEVEFLMWFNQDLLLRRRDELHEREVRILFAGDLEDPRVPERNRRHMEESVALTAGNRRMSVVFAFNYGSRREITEAARRVARAAMAGEIDPDGLDEAAFARHLAVPDMPDCDLIIRSSGEHRLSNFLLWQAAYAEFIFPGVLWPDFDRHHLLEAVVEYQRRDRRFGGAVDRAPG
jgi:undecaprenyl diphosphate synthase